MAVVGGKEAVTVVVEGPDTDADPDPERVV